MRRQRLPVGASKIIDKKLAADGVGVSRPGTRLSIGMGKACRPGQGTVAQAALNGVPND